MYDLFVLSVCSRVIQDFFAHFHASWGRLRPR